MARRRELLLAGAITAIGWNCPVFAQARGGMSLPIPELVDARERGGIDLVAAPRRHSFGPGLPDSSTYGYSASFLGPTLRIRSGESVDVTVENQLDMATTTHWHGLMVPSFQDGGPHEPIEPGDTWRPRLDVAQAEATAWYHAHPHGDTGRQVYMGLAGMMIIEDGTGERLALPRTYGVDDLPIIIQDRRLNARGEMKYDTLPRERIFGTRGELLIVNGAIEPVSRVPTGLVRLRLLNGANARNFHLSFDDSRTFKVIASDGGYLPEPVPMSALTISPGERFEVIVDFSNAAAATLLTEGDPVEGQAGQNGMGTLHGKGPDGTPYNGPGVLVRFEVDRDMAVPATRLPDQLVAFIPPEPAKAVMRRRVTLDMWPGLGGRTGLAGGGVGPRPNGQASRGSGPAMGINGKPFDMHRIDFTTKLGTSEIWEVVPVLMRHPFHVHGAFFRTLSIRGAPPAPHLAGDKDTVLLGEVAELLVTFNQPATHHHPFMIHCHMLDHEDGGLMGQFMTI